MTAVSSPSSFVDITDTVCLATSSVLLYNQVELLVHFLSDAKKRAPFSKGILLA